VSSRKNRRFFTPDELRAERLGGNSDTKKTRVFSESVGGRGRRWLCIIWGVQYRKVYNFAHCKKLMATTIAAIFKPVSSVGKGGLDKLLISFFDVDLVRDIPEQIERDWKHNTHSMHGEYGRNYVLMGWAPAYSENSYVIEDMNPSARH